MRYLILSDMHGNWDALKAVLRKVRRKRFDIVLMLGDLVGYGAAPNQVVDAIREVRSKMYTVRGNHDKVVATLEDGSTFNAAARTAATWTTRKLTSTNLNFVRTLPRGPIHLPDELAICHGSPLDEDTYVFSTETAKEIFRSHPATVTFFGHTHIPCVFTCRSNRILGRQLYDVGELLLEPGARYLINPGSIGQPRDRDPRASYMIYDGDQRVVRWQRLAYPVDRAQERIVKAGLPSVLAERLAFGI